MTAGSARAQFAEKARDWRYDLEGLTITIEKWLTIVGAVCIGLLVFGAPVFLMLADHVSFLNALG